MVKNQMKGFFYDFSFKSRRFTIFKTRDSLWKIVDDFNDTRDVFTVVLHGLDIIEHFNLFKTSNHGFLGKILSFRIKKGKNYIYFAFLKTK